MKNPLRRLSMRSWWSLALLAVLVGAMIPGTAPSAQILAEPAIQANPVIRIYAPEDGALFKDTAGTVITISGFAWDDTNDPGFPDDPVLNPISNPTNSGTFFVTWAPAPGALSYELAESTSPNFDANVITYSNATSPYLVSGKANGLYYYRLRAINVTGPSRWSNVVSTTVGTVAAAAVNVQVDLPIVEVSINGGDWHTATVSLVTPGDYWSWTYGWELPQEDDVVYTIQARVTVGAETSPIDEISVTIDNNIYFLYLPLVMRRYPPVPYAPELNEIANADLNGDYTVTWAYNGPYDVQVPTSYTLQESTNISFTTNLQEFPVVDFSLSFTNKLSGTYYYRVRGNNAAGAGEWSETRSVIVAAKIVDDFSNVDSGWARATYKRSDGGDLMTMNYASGAYQMKVLLATANQNNYKMGLAKAPDRFLPAGPNYDVSVTHYFAQAEMPFTTYKPLEGKAGIVFAANADYTTLYVFEWNWNGLCAINRYNGFAWPVSGYAGFGGTMTTTAIRDWATCTNLQANDYNRVNTLLVEVRDNRATFFVYNNNTKTQIYTFTDDALRSNRRTGLVTGSWAWTPVDSRFDNYTLEAK